MSLGEPNALDVAQMPDTSVTRKINVLLVTSVALSFISFWRAAAIVLCDLASTAYYIGGISEQAIGKAAPWFILGVMLFSYAVRSVYVESCTMFTRGGVYKVVKGALGGGLAKLSVSALMFDYILTGPISAVAASDYLVGLFGDMLKLMTGSAGIFDFNIHPDLTAMMVVLLSVAATVYFWRLNIIGVHESSDKALRIMQLTTVMGVLIIGWSVLTMILRHTPISLPPFHPVFTGSSMNPDHDESSGGWLEHWPKLLGMLGILVAFGHSLLAMSGEESLAQVNREIQAPKLKNLLRAGFVIFLYSLLLTSLVSFLAVLIIPDGMRVQTQIVTNGVNSADAGQMDKGWWEVDYLRAKDEQHPNGMWGYVIDRSTNDKQVVTLTPTHQLIVMNGATQHVERGDGGYRDNLINGLVQFLAGPVWLKIIMEVFVVVVGFLILAGAINTSIVGSNGVLNRLAEDGVLTPWFQHPHKRFGTTHRLINTVAVLQIVVIIASLGKVNTLGEAYAFGVIWSFVFMTMSMTVLRFKDKRRREYEVPLNIHTTSKDGRQIDLPIGIAAVFVVLLTTACINLLTKKTATVWGLTFTAGFLLVFVILERIAHSRHGGDHEHLEQFNERSSDSVSVKAMGLLHPNPIVVAARGPRSLPVLKRVLMETDTDLRDIVVVTCKVLPAMTLGITDSERSIGDADRELLTKIVTVAEEVGKQVHPLVLPTNNPLYAICTAARDLRATEVVLGVSEKTYAEDQLEQFALAWGAATGELAAGETAAKLTVRILGPNVEMKYEME
jgi:amino acid transporter